MSPTAKTSPNASDAARSQRAAVRQRVRDSFSCELVPPAELDLGGSLRLDQPHAAPEGPTFLRRPVINRTFIREETSLPPGDDLLQVVSHWVDMTHALVESTKSVVRMPRRPAGSSSLGTIPEPPTIMPAAEAKTQPAIAPTPAVAENSAKESATAKQEPSAATVAEPRILPLRSEPRRFLEPRYREFRNEILAQHKVEGALCLGLIDVDDDDNTPAVIAGLAATLCDDTAGTRDVLLVDLNLGERRLSRSFGAANLPGLGEHLLDGTDLDETIVPTSLHGVSLFPCGARRPRDYRDLEPEAWQRLFAGLREQYAAILVDLPADSLLSANVASHLDGVHLWVRLNRTPRARLDELIRRLGREGAPKIGCLLIDLPQAA